MSELADDAGESPSRFSPAFLLPAPALFQIFETHASNLLTNPSVWVIISSSKEMDEMAKFVKNGTTWMIETTQEEHEAVKGGKRVVTVHMADGTRKPMTVTDLRSVREYAGKKYYSYGFVSDKEKSATRPTQPAPQRKETPIPANAKSIERRSAGKSDGYEVGAVLYLPKIAGGGGDGHCWRVIDAGKYRDDDYDEWMATATVAPATDAESAPVMQRIAAKTAAKAEAEALMRALGASKSYATLLPDAPKGEHVTLWDDSRAGGSERWIAIGEQVYYTESSYDDGPRWWASSATIEVVQKAKANGLIRPSLLWSK